MSFQAVATAIDKNKKSILSRQNVVSVGCGYHDKDLGIIVGVSEKLPEIGLMSADVIPSTIDGIPTKVHEVGIIRVGQSDNVDPRIHHRPIFPGLSVGHFNVTAGTFGCIVSKNGEEFMLSNNHVLANSNNANIGDAIWQPGRYDGGSSDDVIGTLYEYVPIIMNSPGDGGDDGGGSPPTCSVAKKVASAANYIAKKLGRTHRLQAYNSQATGNRVDCALARLSVAYNKTVPNIGSPKGVSDAELGMEVQKFGRTTYYTTGVITQVHMSVNVSYGGNNIATFEDQIGITPMSEGGDSGSSIYDMNGNLVALLFAGSTSITICNPIQAVFDALKVTLPL